MTTSDLIASLSFAVSLGTLAWTYIKDKKQEPALQVTAKIVNELDPYGYQTKGPDLFSLYMVNVGHRRIYLKGWYMRTNGPNVDGAFLVEQNLPEFLEPGAHHTELVRSISFLNSSTASIYGSDSTGKDWAIKNSNLKKIISQAERLNEATDPVKKA